MLLHQFMNGALEVMHPTAIQKDTTFTKIFVGGLPYHTNDASLRKYFEAFGDIDEAVVITDRQTGKSRGYGFVSSRRREKKYIHKVTMVLLMSVIRLRRSGACSLLLRSVTTLLLPVCVCACVCVCVCVCDCKMYC